MSGFEIAGIVLGAFSVLGDAARDAHGPYQKLKRWWRFGIAFEDFLLRLDTERVAFLQNLDNLLSLTDISDTQKDLLMGDPHCVLWNDLRIQAELRHRITDLYFDWHITVLSDIREALREINAFLPVKNIHQIDSKGFEDILFRAKSSFSSRKDRLLERIQNRNEEISKFLLRESIQPRDAPQRPRSTKSMTSSRPFLRAQRKSKELHDVLQSVWKCKCPSSHLCGITSALDFNTKPLASRLSLLVKDSTEHHLLRMEEADEGDNEILTCSSMASSVVKDIPDLRHQLAIKNKSKKLSTPKGVLKVFGKSTLSSFLTPLGQNKTSHPTVIASSSQGTVATTLSSSTSTTAAPVKPKTGVRFASSVALSLNSAHPKAYPLTDLCASLALPNASTSILGSLQAKDHQAKFFLHLGTAGKLSASNAGVETLANFLSATPRRFARVQVGLAIVVNLLSLDSSVWVPSDLDKTRVWVIKESDDDVSIPYLFRPDLFSNPKPEKNNQPSPEERTQRCFLALGILLLELLFGQTLEQQPERSSFMGPDGKPNQYTDMCTAMEWQKKVVLDVGDGLPEAIQKCLYCGFGVERDISSARFTQAVLDNVVEPLRDFLSRWNTKVSVSSLQ